SPPKSGIFRSKARSNAMYGLCVSKMGLSKSRWRPGRRRTLSGELAKNHAGGREAQDIDRGALEEARRLDRPALDGGGFGRSGLAFASRASRNAQSGDERRCARR